MTETKPLTVKEIRKREAEEKATKLREQCEAYAKERFTEKTIVEASNKYGGLFYLPILSEDETTIEKFAVFTPINRHVLSYASTKLADGGMYVFIEQVMRDTFLFGDMEIIDDDAYFLSAAEVINKIIDAKKAAFVKR